jgi:hypothetical protein
MKRAAKTTSTMLLAALLATLPVWAQASIEKVQGEVIQVQQQQQTRNQGEFDQIMIRTRQGEELRLRLGAAGQCGDCVRVGDQIRARVMAGSGGQPGQVQSMKVRRNGELFAYQNQAGQLLQTRQRLRDGSGSGQPARDRQQARIHDPGSANCRGGGGGAGRGNGGGGGGGR